VKKSLRGDPRRDRTDKCVFGQLFNESVSRDHFFINYYLQC
jgi:hypothetical protein